jgi:penicillin amidase
VEEDKLTPKEKEYLSIVKDWDLMASPDSKGQTVYVRWWDVLKNSVALNLKKGGMKNKIAFLKSPNIEAQTILEILKRDTSYFAANLEKDEKYLGLNKVTFALKLITKSLDSLSIKNNGLEWYKYNNPSVNHLIKDLAGFARKGLHTGGNGDIVNAIKGSHGPSWRMVVQLTTPTEAYGVYPGGQSGNPGSKYYDNFVDSWAEGKYNKLWFMRDGDKTDKNVKWIIKFGKG